jgi:hypothetical protein
LERFVFKPDRIMDYAVMPGLVPGIHAVRRPPTFEGWCGGAAWMTGTSPVMTA